MSSSRSSYHHGNLAEELERAALDLLDQHSAAELSLRAVARQAGVSHNAPYHHFGDRQQLLKRVAERAMADHLDAQERAVAEITDPRERLIALGVAYVTHAAEHPHAFNAIFDPDICVPGAPSERMAPLIKRNEDLLDSLVRDMCPGKSEAEIGALGAGLWGAAHGMATLVVAGHLPVEVAPHALRSLLAQVANDSQRPRRAE